ncbi:MAG TPA: GNAT family N-acetyltransferase [Actinomycetota bacterium]|nr:GNAT family N-acetyltransferase [Actinomycetota bacterium]
MESLLAYWRAQDALFERVEPAWWGAVVSDARYPAIQEPNYARVESREPVPLAEVGSALLPAMDRSGSARSHVVIFHPEEQTDLIAQASTRGERITWDLVMVRGTGRVGDEDEAVEEVRDFDAAFWRAHAASVRLFDVNEQPAVDQLQALERDVLIPAGRRWLTVRENGEPVAFAAFLVLEGAGFLDHVVTFPVARRRGYAQALARRAVAEIFAAGARHTFLLAEPGGSAERIYARLGFERAGYLASWLSPIAR